MNTLGRRLSFVRAMACMLVAATLIFGICTPGQLARAYADEAQQPCTLSFCGSFKDLQKLVDATPSGGTLYLDGASYINSTKSSAIQVTKNITINGASRYDGSLTSYVNGGSCSKRIVSVAEGVNVTFENMVLLDGESDYGGAVKVRGYAGATFRNCEFRENKASDDGGACYFEEGSYGTFESCRFCYNVSGEDGGALNFDSYADGRVTDCIFWGNQAEQDGGAMCFCQHSQGILNGVTAVDNAAGSHGGCAYFGPCTTVKQEIYNSSFTGNTAKAEGGALFFAYNADSRIEGTSFTQNTSNSDGGACFFYSPDTVLSNTDFIGNVSGNCGGAAYFFRSCSASLSNVKGEDNHCAENGGCFYFGHLLGGDEPFALENVSIVRNTCSGDVGAGIYCNNDAESASRVLLSGTVNISGNYVGDSYEARSYKESNVFLRTRTGLVNYTTYLLPTGSFNASGSRIGLSSSRDYEDTAVVRECYNPDAFFGDNGRSLRMDWGSHELTLLKS